MLLAIASVCAYANGPRSIGANIGYDLGLNYQHGFGTSNMLDVNAYFGFYYRGASATITYDWINPGGLDVPWSHAGAWYWYAGVGGAGGVGGIVKIQESDLAYINGFVGVAGHLGIEYEINHFAVSLDTRPTIGVHFDTNPEANKVVFNPFGLANGLNLGLKYRF